MDYKAGYDETSKPLIIISIGLGTISHVRRLAYCEFGVNGEVAGGSYEFLRVKQLQDFNKIQ